MEKIKMDERWLNEKQISELTGVAVGTLRNDRSKGTGLPYCKIGRSVRYSESAIQEILRSRMIVPARKK
jgi:predicted DNA-binding transcriptional regulator AlpA